MYKDTVVRPTGETFEIIAHPAPGAHAIIINYPGRGGDINGFNNKYQKLGQYLSDQGVGAFIQMPNIEWPRRDYRETLIEDLLAVCDYADRSTHILRDPAAPSLESDYELYLMGFSAGASAVAGAAHESGATKILLMAPSGNASCELVTASLQNYTGEVYIAVGEDDEVVGANAGQRFFEMAENASKRSLQMIPNCDHQFRGRENGMIMSKAPLWAFAGDETFPNPEGGIVLY